MKFRSMRLILSRFQRKPAVVEEKIELPGKLPGKADAHRRTAQIAYQPAFQQPVKIDGEVKLPGLYAFDESGNFTNQP